MMEANQLWGYIVGAIGLLVGVAGWLRNAKGDTSAQAQWQGAVGAKLDHITLELSRMSDVRERVALVESSAKSLHHRMDEHVRIAHGGQEK